MDKRQSRTSTKRNHVMQVALTLFTRYGRERVSMDEIAATANVSKVTLYKYFGSKDILYREIVDQFMEETLAATEAVFHSDIDFLAKLRFALLTQIQSSQWIDWHYLFQAWDRDSYVASPDGLQHRVNTLIYRFVEEGKANGYIDPTISVEAILLYAELFRAGLKAISQENPSLLGDKATLETLFNFYFFGLLKR